MLYLFPVAAVINHHKLSVLKLHSVTDLEARRLKSGPSSEALGRILFLAFFQLLGAVGFPGLGCSTPSLPSSSQGLLFCVYHIFPVCLLMKLVIGTPAAIP